MGVDVVMYEMLFLIAVKVMKRDGVAVNVRRKNQGGGVLWGGGKYAKGNGTHDIRSG